MAAKKTFEENMARQEAIVTMLEKGDATLGDSMALFEEGTKLVNQCRKELDSAEQKVVKLSNDRYLSDEKQSVAENNLYANMLALAIPSGGGGVSEWAVHRQRRLRAAV